MSKLKSAPNQEIIEMLGLLLNDAKKGKVQAIAVSSICSGAVVTDIACPLPHQVELLGALLILQARLVERARH